MADEDVILEFKKKAEHLQPYLENIDYKSYQLEDVESSELRLKWRGHIFKKDLKGKDLKEQENAPVHGMSAFGNELYYRQNRKIFKAFFVFPKIKVSLYDICTRRYLLEWRICGTTDFWLIKRNENSFVTDGIAKCYVKDDNTVYLSHNGELALIRNGEIEHLSYIWIPDSSPDQFRNIHKIVGVYNGVITVEVKTTDIDGYTIKKELWTARLNTVERKESTAAMLKAIHDMTAEMKELRKNQEQLIDGVVKINQSLIKIIARK